MSEYEVGEIPPEQLKKQAKRYGLEDFVKGRVDNETMDRIAHKADELQRMNLGEKMKPGQTQRCYGPNNIKSTLVEEEE